MFGKFFDSVRSHLRARAEEEVLMNLSDAALEDIGLTRTELSALRLSPKPARTEQAAVAPLFGALAFPVFLQAA